MPSSTFNKSIILEKAVSELNAYVPFAKKEQTENEKKLQGTINRLHIQNHAVSHELRDPNEDLITRTYTIEKNDKGEQVNKLTITQKPPIEKHPFIRIAILKPKKRHQEKVEEAKAALNHLQQLENKAVDPSVHPTQFIQRFLYHGKGGKVSMAANGGDLFEWINKYGFSTSPTLFKEIFAQIFLGINALHSDGKAHRDIKFENCLVFLKNQMYVVIADVDTVILIDETNISFIGTLNTLSPECKDITSYEKAAKKPVDCFALGATIKALFDPEKGEQKDEFVPVLDKEVYKDLYQLTLDLTNQDPEHRFTIQQAMDSPYFGNTPEARQTYFDKIIKKHALKYDEYFDSYYYDPKRHWYPAFDDNFFILPQALKEILMQATSLISQLKVIYEFPFTFEDANRVVHRICRLEEFLDAYTKINSPLNMHLEAIFKLLTLGLEIAKKHLAPWACFTEEKINNGEDLHQFFERRSDDQKKDDFIAVFENLARLLESEKNKGLTNYQRSILGKVQSHHLPTDKLPKLTALTHILLFKAQKPKASSHIQHEAADELSLKKYASYKQVNKVVNNFLNPELKKRGSAFYKPLSKREALSIEMTSDSEPEQKPACLKLE